MNEPKKRGRPSNAEIAARQAAPVADDAVAKAQAYALRVWAGQSPSAMVTSERIERVRLALQGQNLACEGVELPGGHKL